MKNKELVKQAKPIKHICDRIYVNKNMNEVLGVYPFYNKRKESVYRVALRKTLTESLLRVLAWLSIDLAGAFIAFACFEFLPPLAVIIAIVLVIMNVVSIVLNIKCFNGRLLENITVFPFGIESKIEDCANGISVSDDDLINMKNYKDLDSLSQIANTPPIRRKKVQLLLALEDKFEYDWTYETDTLLHKNDAAQKDLHRYLNKIRSMDEDLLGRASRKELGSRKK